MNSPICIQETISLPGARESDVNRPAALHVFREIDHNFNG
jgi:hypothetical protein